LLVTDVAAVFLVSRIVGIVKAHRAAALDGVRVGIPNDWIHGARGVIRDPQGLQRDGVAVRVDPIRQKLPCFGTGAAGFGSKGWMPLSGCPPPGTVGIR